MTAPMPPGFQLERRDFVAVQTAHCSECSSICDFRNNKGRAYPPSVLLKMLGRKGWRVDKNRGRHVCPDCVERGKNEMIEAAKKPREMQPADRRRIFRELEGVYDEAKCRYVDDWTDHTLAEKLAVPRKWVETIREENFGPAGENLEMERVATLIGRLEAESRAAIEKCMAAAAEAESVAGELAGCRKRLDAIKAAVGPRGAAS